MAFVHRKLWSYKPKQYGPWKIVHRDLMHNVERVGGDSFALSCAMPLWDKVGQKPINYASPVQVASVTNSFLWGDNGVVVDDNTQVTLTFEKSLLPVPPPGTCCFLAKMKNTAAVSASSYPARFKASGQTRWWGIRQSSSAEYRYFESAWHRVNNVGVATVGIPLGTLCLNSLTPTDHKSYIDGDLFQTSVSNNFLDFDYNYNEIVFSGLNTGDFFADQFLIFTKGQSENFIQEVTDHPWKLWQKVPQITYFLPQVDTGATLTIQDPAQAQSIDSPALVQQHTLAIDPVNQPQTLGNVALIQANVLVVSDTDQPQAIDNIDLSTGSTLVVQGSTQTQTLDPLDLVQQNTLAVDPTDQAQDIDNLDLGTGITLIVPGSTQPQTLDPPDLIQQSTLAIDPTDQAQSVDNITLSAGVVLQIAETVQAQNIDEITLIPQYTLAIDPVNQPQAIDNITLDAGVILAIAEMIQSQALDNLILTQAGNLAIDPMTQGQTIDNVVFAQVDGKIVITLTIKSPGATMGIKSPGINLEAT